MPSKPVLYWDADVLLSYVDAEPGRVDHIRALLTEADRGDHEIVTSMLSVTEVAFGAQEKVAGVLDDETNERIDKLWSPPSPVRLIEFHYLIAQRARDLQRERIQRQWPRLNPADAIHLASAESASATRLHTYNTNDFERWADVIGVVVEEPMSLAPGML
jgi:predicted nucleic acid-binding protein